MTVARAQLLPLLNMVFRESASFSDDSEYQLIRLAVAVAVAAAHRETRV